MRVDGMPWVLGEGALGCGGGPRGLVSGARSLVCCSVRPTCSLERAVGCGLCASGFAFASSPALPTAEPAASRLPRGPGSRATEEARSQRTKASPLWISEVTASAERCL